MDAVKHILYYALDLTIEIYEEINDFPRILVGGLGKLGGEGSGGEEGMVGREGWTP